MPVRPTLRPFRVLVATLVALGLGLAACSTAEPETLSAAPTAEAFGEFPEADNGTIILGASGLAAGGDTEPSPTATEAPLPIGPPPTDGSTGRTGSAAPGNASIASATAAFGGSLDSALTNLDRAAPAARERIPVGLTIGSLAVLDAPVTSVGALPNGEMEIPGASEVGWYEFGAAPGEAGSAVLAAHIAYNGEDGVFRYLNEAKPGERVWVHYNDGTTDEFEIFALSQFDKDELPTDVLFAEEGQPILTLITCGGDFNRSLNSYEDNVVALAVPVT